MPNEPDLGTYNLIQISCRPYYNRRDFGYDKLRKSCGPYHIQRDFRYVMIRKCHGRSRSRPCNSWNDRILVWSLKCTVRGTNVSEMRQTIRASSTILLHLSIIMTSSLLSDWKLSVLSAQSLVLFVLIQCFWMAKSGCTSLYALFGLRQTCSYPAIQLLLFSVLEEI